MRFDKNAAKKRVWFYAAIEMQRGNVGGYRRYMCYSHDDAYISIIMRVEYMAPVKRLKRSK